MKTPQSAAFARPTAAISTLQEATVELGYLLDRGYGRRAALVLVGDRHQLTLADRKAVSRCTCSATEALDRGGRRLRAAGDEPVWVDGYNVLTSLQLMTLGGPLLLGRDGCARDMAGVHGRWRREVAVEAALQLLTFWPGPLHWLFDGPVSGSARDVVAVQRFAQTHNLAWTAEVVADPDPVLAATDHIIATADAAILDAGGPWLDLVCAAAALHDAEMLALYPST